MTDQVSKLLASASLAAAGANDIIESVRYCGIRPIENVGSGETLTALADSLRLLIEAMDSGEQEVTQMYGAVSRFLEDRT